MKAEVQSKYIKIKDAALETGMSETSIWRYCKSGIIECDKTPGGICKPYRSSVQQLIQSMRNHSAGRLGVSNEVTS